MSGEKTEKPTEQRKRQARKEGQVARTPDLGAWGGIFIASMVIPMVGQRAMKTGQALYMQAMTIIEDPDPIKALKLLTGGIRDGAVAVAPLAVGLMVFAVLAASAQGGLRVATKKLKPDFSRLNPFKGIKQTFGGHALWEGAKALSKTAVVGGVLYLSVRHLVPVLLSAGSVPVEVLLSTIVSTVLNVIRAAAAAGLIMAAADYAVARRRIGKQIRMSKQDIKDEHKKSEGDPHQKGHIRQRQMEMSRSRMMSDLPKADVVLVNPTHVAVALSYDPEKGAPRVIAKGAGAIATKIREKATELRIPMVQDVPLARALYKDCDIGREIPADFYGAVARVLAFVMMLKAKGSAAGVHRNTMSGSSV
jgi:flagellar biosynthetic protein FlhB